MPIFHILNILKFSRMLECCFQTRKSEIPISANNVVQTGPNTHAGGLRAGFASSKYQSDRTAGAVKNAPITPAASETAIAITNLKKLFIRIKLFYNILTFLRMLEYSILRRKIPGDFGFSFFQIRREGS